MIGFRPIHSNAGNEINVPPPAIALIAPATNAATAMISHANTRGSVVENSPES
jgi:hypothetical protein